MNLEFAILAGALTAIYAGMKNIMDTVYVINSKRDIILDIDEDGQRLDKTRKSHILRTDVFPMIVGLSLFLAVYTSAFFLLAIGIQLNRIEKVHSQFAWFLHAAGVASLYALFIVITKNYYSYQIMKAYIQKLPGNDQEWNLLPIAADQEEIPKTVENTATNKPMHPSGGSADS